jgi:hypothetical protein
MDDVGDELEPFLVFRRQVLFLDRWPESVAHAPPAGPDEARSIVIARKRATKKSR